MTAPKWTPTKSKTTKKTASGGGHKMDQMKLGKGFIAVPPRTGHKQKSNVKK
jgi:hypothetical protein